MEQINDNMRVISYKFEKFDPKLNRMENDLQSILGY